MRHINSMILLASIVILVGGANIAAQEEPFRDVIRAQWDRYKEELKEYQFRITKSHHNLLTGQQNVNFVTVQYTQRDSWKLIVGETKEDGRRCCSAVAINSWYAFRLEKDKNASPWRVGEIDLDLSNGVQLDGVTDPTEDHSYRYSPFVLGDSGFLPTLVTRPGFSVTKTESAGTPEEGLSKVWFKVVADEVSNKAKGKIPIEGTGWLLLDPKHYWRIKEFDLPFYSPRFSKYRATAKYQYHMARDNYPLLKQIDIAYYPPESSEKPDTRTVIDYEFEKRVPAEKEFRLSGFGFPEPMGAPPIDTGTRWWLWLSLAAVGAVAFGFLFIKVKNRYSTAQPVKVGEKARP